MATGGGLNIPANAETTVTATPFNEYEFVNWTKAGEVVSTENEYTFEVKETCHLVANFRLQVHTISVSANPLTFGTVSGGGEFEHGQTATVHATARPDYMFVNWTENGNEASRDADYSFTVTRSRALVANFDTQKYWVIVEVNDTIFGNAYGGGFYEADTLVHVWAVPKDGFSFSHWTINGALISTSDTYEFTVTHDITLVAHFYALDFDTYAATMWNNTFMLNLNLLTEEGYDVSDCKWFKNGKIETETHSYDAFSYSAGPKITDLLEPDPTFYMFRITLDDGAVLYSTKKVIPPYQTNYAPSETGLIIYPNPAYSGNYFTVEGTVKGAPLFVYNQFGMCIYTSIATGEKTLLALDLPAGVYLVRSEEKTGKVVIVK
jgi:hypothetical protein